MSTQESFALGHSIRAISDAVDSLHAAGEDGLSSAELYELSGIPESNHGYIIYELRRLGYLVQCQEGRYYLPERADFEPGNWVRHKEFGVVQIQFYRNGFPSAVIRPIGDRSKIRVPISDLSAA